MKFCVSLEDAGRAVREVLPFEPDPEADVPVIWPSRDQHGRVRWIVATLPEMRDICQRDPA